MPEKSRKNRVDLVPINKRGDLTVGEREWRRQMAEQWNKSTAEYRGFTGSSGREHMLPYRYRDLTNRWKYEGVAGSRGYELPGAEVEGVEVSAKRKRVDGYAYGGRVKGKEAKPMKKMAEAKMERSKKDMASDARMKGYGYGGKVADPKSGVREGEMSSKKQGMDPKSAARLDEMKWVKGVQKKAGYAFGGMVKGGKGKKGC